LTPGPQRSETPATALTIAAALIGAALIGWGLWLIHPAAAAIFAGGLLWLGALRIARERKPAP
jgi:hypothetical protein